MHAATRPAVTPPGEAPRRGDLPWGLVTGLAALVFVALAWLGPPAARPLAIVLALAAVAWRWYRLELAERESRERLALVSQATRILHGEADLDVAIVALLTEARRTFRAGFAELVLFTGDGRDEGLRTTLGPGDHVEVMTGGQLDTETDAIRIRAVATREAFIVPREAGGRSLADRVAGHTVREAMVAPLAGERALIGTFLLADRRGGPGTFRPSDLELFRTIAIHAGIALENGQLGRSLQDLSEQKDRLRHQAMHDSLTGLGNRDLFLERLTAQLRRRDRGIRPAVLFVDLDEFKSINDTLGHAAGDAVLREVAARLRTAIRPSDLAARLSGDEFAVLLEDGRDIGGVMGVAERIIDAVGRPIELESGWASTSASVGLAVARRGLETAEELLHEADVAMYGAKGRGKGRFAVFDPRVEIEIDERQRLRDDLAAAVSRRELSLRYQPERDLRTNELTGFEALLRWEHPTRGELMPAAFIGLAEESSLIVPIGRWVLRQACREVGAWARESGRPLGVSVNVSVRQLRQSDFAEDVAEVLAATGLPPERLTLELAEGQIMTDDPLIAERLAALKAVGVQLAIDGFGTGFSSVRHLGRFPVDAVKMARPVVATMLRSETEGRVAQAIVSLAHSLDLAVVAEGIESRVQLERAREMTCDRAQGFFLAGPLHAMGVRELLGVGAEAEAAA
jgi:diguanylate cyclase (GGDEF)-like protein